MSGALLAATKSDPAPKQIVTPAPAALLQRACDCGGSPGLDGDCAECRAQRLQRSAIDTAPDEVPAIVREVLRSSGQPLDAATRAFMEPRFGHDFSQVRVHADAKATESARAVGALAYTVGRDVVFGAGQYAPGTRGERSLIAHELSHTLQQSIEGRRNGAGLSADQPNTALERQADSMAKAVMSGSRSDLTTSAITDSAIRLQRQGMGELRVAEALSEERANEEEARARTTEPMNMTRRILTEGDVERATRAAPSATSPGRITPGIRGARFVLHDTAALTSAARISEHEARGRRSSGEGAGAWVPGSTAAVITHQPFFGPRRPAATQFERGQDIMVKATREKEYRSVWNASDRTQREAALDAVLAAQGSPPAEATAERTAAIAQLQTTTGDVRSAAAWAVEDICRNVFNRGAVAVAASSGVAPNLEGTCQRLGPLFTARAARIGSTVNIEIVQERGSDCRTTGSLNPLPPYTAGQYTNLMQLYLRAALEARFFPEITTHFLIDKGVGDHCDPRCFRLNQLYEDIRVAVGHRSGSIYGITPNYGTGAAHNVWWHDTVCGGPHP